MNPDTIREIKKRQRYYKSYLNELTEGKISKKFKPVAIDLVQEFWENKNVIEDFHKGLREEIEKDDSKEPFNLDQEIEEKVVDERGNFLLLRERLDQSDPWFESIENQPFGIKKLEKEETRLIDVEKCKKALKKLLRDNETVAQAIKRLRGKVEPKRNFKKNVRKGNSSEATRPELLSEDFETICKLCSDLVAEGCEDLYDWKIADLSETNYWKLKGENGLVGPVNDQQIKIWKSGGKLKGFLIQRTDKAGNSTQGDTWIDFDTFELY